MSIYQDRIIITGRLLTPGLISQNPLDDQGDNDPLAGQNAINSISPPFVLPLDNAMMQGFRFSNIITKQPTNAGTPRNDNIARLPISYKVEGYISQNTWYRTKLGPLLIDFNSIFTDEDYLRMQFRNISKGAMNPYIFEVNAGIGIFQSMAIESIEVIHNPEAKNCLKLSIVMQEAIKSPSGYRPPENNKNKPPLNRGQQSG